MWDEAKQQLRPLMRRTLSRDGCKPRESRGQHIVEVFCALGFVTEPVGNATNVALITQPRTSTPFFVHSTKHEFLVLAVLHCLPVDMSESSALASGVVKNGLSHHILFRHG